MGRLRVDRVADATLPLLDGDGRLVLARCHVARRPWPRLVGLLGTPRLGPGEGLWLEPCAGVHAVGLRLAVGVALLDRHGVVLRVVDPLPRGRAVWARAARAAVEAAPGVLRALPPGARLTLAEDRSMRTERAAQGGAPPPPAR